MPDKHIRVVLPGLLMAMLLAMLDNVIVGTAMPRIVGDLGGVDHLSWVVTAYVLGATVSTPIWGKLGDLYGRKTVFLTSIVLFLLGSVLCGFAQDMPQLIGFRAFQGLGSGGLMVGAMAVLGDLVPPRERGRYQGQFAAVMAVAMVGGPLVGGFITDHADWRWAFFVNLPLGGAALVLLALRLDLPKRRTEHRIDWFGAALLSAGVTALVLITTWGGNQYAWGSAQILGLAALAVVSLAVFVVVERRHPEPILPLGIFRNRNFSLVSGVGFLVGFAMFGAITFLPLYQQIVQGASATNSGLLLLPMMGGLLVTSLLVGRMITKTGKYRIYPVIGGLVMILAMVLLSRLDADTSKLESGIYMTVLGLGMGFLMQTSMLIAQNSVELKDLGVASSTATFARSIGGAFGVAAFGAIFNHRLHDLLADRVGPQAADRLSGGGGGGATIGPATLGALPAQVRTAVVDSIAGATSSVFLWAVAATVLVPLLAVFIREVALRGGPETAQERAESTLVAQEG
ncbi:MFS transporter [Dactylosporangium aurantiacum]|uniref:MFS transporter n=1 Tax=Dactylosporangium aurantiacum TaxID=35754 RepID=A0A9Q9IH83_9ACTN|nr:MDR family MFS transporter [Dactylosporangium aurantiacum]MDG6104830.1 MDR family MFS transporter [Dactylosporangium aurantiacum]UWZ55621.1 MFS transporter [Dactylosporangium aurantiacum]